MTDQSSAPTGEQDRPTIARGMDEILKRIPPKNRFMREINTVEAWEIIGMVARERDAHAATIAALQAERERVAPVVEAAQAYWMADLHLCLCEGHELSEEEYGIALAEFRKQQDRLELATCALLGEPSITPDRTADLAMQTDGKEATDDRG